MTTYVNLHEQFRQLGVKDILSLTPQQGQQMAYNAYRQAGLIGSSWQSVQGQSVADYAKSKSGTLEAYAGFYDQGKYNSLVSGLGSTSSDTLLKRLNAFSADSSRFYNMMADYGTFKSWWNSTGGIKWTGDGGMVFDLGMKSGESVIQDSWLGLQDVGKYLNQQQTNISNELSAQFGREQNFLSGVTGLTQTATQAKMAADQKAAQEKLNQEFAAGQAALEQTAQQNAAAIAEQQAKQDAAFAQAQQAAQEAAQAQQTQLNETAQTTALSNAATSAKQQATLAVQNLESRANSLQGNPIVTTNASTTSKQRGSTSRTDRWLARRTPAPGGGGASI